MHESRTRNTVLKIICIGREPAEATSHILRLAPCAPAPADTGGTRSLANILHPGNSHDIPFQGHGERLDALRQWMEDTTRNVSVQIITGRAGQGKTRLGTELVNRARDRGWMAGFLPPGNADIFTGGPFTTEWHQPTLVIVDNAASRVRQVRAWLRALVRQPRGVHPLRLVLLERAGLDSLWVDDIFGPDNAGDAGLPALLSPAQWPELGPLTGADARYAVFAAAYRAACGTPPPADTAMTLRHKLDAVAREGSTLFLIALGFVAAREGLLLARTLGVPSLLSRMVAGEVQRIRTLWQADGGVPEAIWPQALHLAGISALCGGMDATTLRQAIETEVMAGQHDASTLTATCLHALSIAQPGQDGGTAISLPDTVADAFGLHLLMLRAVDALDRVFACPSLHLRLIAGISRACQVSWDVTEDDRPLAWLKHLAGLCGQDRNALQALARYLPRQGMDMQAVALDAVENLVAGLRADEASGPAALMGRTLTALFHRHADLWHPEPARRAARQALAIHSDLAGQDPAFRPAHAAALHDIAQYDNGLNDPAGALPMARQALAAYTTLARDDPGTFRPHRARSLYQVALSHDALGRNMAARRALRHAITIQTMLADAYPVTFQPELAASLLALSLCQASMEQLEEARETGLEAVILYSGLAHDHPDTFQPTLAGSLHQLGHRQIELKQYAAALKSVEEAFSLQTAMTERWRGAGRRDVARSLVTLAQCQHSVGRRDDALQSMRDAVGHYRILAQEGPAVFRPILAQVLTRLDASLAGRAPFLTESVETVHEAVDLYTALAQEDPQRFTPLLAGSLATLSDRQDQNGQVEDAIRSISAAHALYRDLALHDPDTFQSGLMDSFGDLGNLLMGSDRADECTAALEELLALQREIVARNPDNLQQRAQLGMVLIWRATMQIELDLCEQAFAPWRESLRIRTQLAARQPEMFGDGLNDALDTLNHFPDRTGLSAQRLAMEREAIDCLASLVQQHPAIFTSALIAALENLSRRLIDDGQPDAALQTIQHAISVHHGRMDEQVIDDGKRHAALARSMDILAYAYKTLGRYDDMLRIVEAMLGIYQRLVEKGEYGFEWELAKKQSVLAMCQMHLGQTDSALASTIHAISMLRAFADRHMDTSGPSIYELEPALAANLARASALHETLGQHDAALQSAEDATALYRELAAREPADFAALLAECLQALPRLRQMVTGRDDFQACTHEAVALYRELDAAQPERFRPDLAHFLARLSAYQWQAQPPAWADALKSAQEAVSIHADLYAASPDLHRTGYADSLYKVFLCHNGLEQLDQALTALKQSLALYRILAADHPGEFRPRLAQCLLDLAQYLMTYKDHDGALHTVHEATSLLTDLAQTDRAAFQPILKKARAMHAMIVRKRSR